jgi:hypothetical protein
MPARRVLHPEMMMKRSWLAVVLAFVMTAGGLVLILINSDHNVDHNVPGRTTAAGRNSLASPEIRP